MFLLLFSLSQMDGLEWSALEEGEISATVKAKHHPMPQIERIGHYGTFVSSGNSLCERKCCVGSVDARHFAPLVN